jgi:hypothetical protein
MTQYTLIHQNSMPLINHATTDSDSYILEPSQRLLMDSPPEYNIEIEALRIVEPVPEDATQFECVIITERVVPNFSRFQIRGPM